MAKSEQTKAIEKTGNKKEIVKNTEGSAIPKEAMGANEEITKETQPEKSPEIKVKKPEKPKKTEAFVNAYNIPISTKHSMAICKFIKGKTIAKAKADLESVVKMKKAVPMKGEIPHRKGDIMSGRYPQKATRNFLVLLKSLEGNSQDINVPIITEAISNIGERPYGRFGRVRKKRTHIYIKAVEKSKLKELNKKKKGKKK